MIGNTVQLTETENNAFQVTDPHLRIALTSIARDIFENLQQDDIHSTITAELHKRDSLIKDSVSDYVSKIADSVTKEGINQSIITAINALCAKTEQRLANLENQVSDLRRFTMADHWITQLNDVTKKAYENDACLREIQYQVKEYISDMSIQLVRDEELKFLYKKSGLKLQGVADRFKVTIQQASNLINGHVENLNTRNDLKMFLKDAVRRNEGRTAA